MKRSARLRAGEESSSQPVTYNLSIGLPGALEAALSFGFAEQAELKCS
jgi:hypothetical protein